MALVVHARDPRFKRQVAIKILPSGSRDDAPLKKRFEREAETIAAFEHPSIVPVYDTGTHRRRPYIVMRYMAGGSLAARVRQGPLAVVEAIGVLYRIASALDFAHSQGVVHRDLKPANILFDQFGDAYLSDFGIVMLEEATQSLTKTGAIIGTPAYMSPEQVQGDGTVDAFTDIYSLGIILFEMLTGHQPFSADTPTRLMMRHVLDPIPDLQEFNPDLPPAAQSVIKRAMAKDKQERYPTAGQLAHAARVLLEAERRGNNSVVRPPPRPRPKLELKFPKTLLSDDLLAAPRRTIAELPQDTRTLLKFAPVLLALGATAFLIGGSGRRAGAGSAPDPSAEPPTSQAAAAILIRTPTPIPSATESPVPTATSSPTPTLVPSPTATPEYVWLVVSDGARCRTGPSRGFPTFGFLVAGDLVQAYGRNEQASWWWVEMPDGSGRCWVSAALVSEPLSPFVPPSSPAAGTETSESG